MKKYRPNTIAAASIIASSMTIFNTAAVAYDDSANHWQSEPVPISYADVSQRAEAHGFSLQGLDDLKQSIVNDIEAGYLPGANVLIARKGQIIAQYSIGYADRESLTPLTPDHLFRIYSMSKPVSAAIAMQQIEDNAYSLDTRIDALLPALNNRQVYTDQGLIAAKQPITMRHLLTHTSGFTAAWGSSPVAKMYQESGVIEYKPHSYKGAANSLPDLVARLSHLPLAHQPGERRTYGISNDVQGLFMARADNTTAPQLLANRITQPLGMIDTDFCVKPLNKDRLTAMYQADDEGVVSLLETPQDSAFTCPVAVASFSGGLVSTINDYYQFAQMLNNHGTHNGEPLLAPASVNLLATPQAFVEEGDWVKGADWGLSFAIVTDASKSIRTEYNGNYYWAGSANTSFWVDPTHDMVALFFTQVRNSSLKPSLQTRFRNRVYEAFEGRAKQ